MTDRKIAETMSDMEKSAVMEFAECDMHLSQAARKFYISHQGFRHHLIKVRVKTGLDPRNFYDLHRLVKIINAERIKNDRE